MLDILRKKGVSKRIIWFIVIIIIISFGFLGTAYLVTDKNNAQYAGKIFGRNISIDNFNKAYQDVTIQAIIRYGDKFNSIRQYLNLESETWDRLILLNEANKRSIKVSDAEVVKAVGEYSFFQRDGQFDSLLYKDINRYVFKIDPRQFEENVRENLKLTKMIDQETSQLNVTEDEIFKAFQDANVKVQVSYIFVSPDPYKAEAVSTEAEEKEYYDSHKNDFELPESISVDYIAFPLPVAADPSKESEISAAKDALREKVKTIYSQLSSNPDLAKTAKENNLEVKSTGLFSFDQPNLSLGWSLETLQNLFTEKKDSLISPFESAQSIFIAKITDKKDASIPDFAQVQAKVKETLLTNKAKAIAKDKAKDILGKVKDAISKTSFVEFSKIAKDLGADIEQTPAFIRGQYLPKIGIERDFQETAFQLSDNNKLSDIVETQKGWCILYLDNIIQADKNEYEKQKKEFADKYYSERKMKYFNDFLTGLRLKANLVDNISKLKEKN